MKEGFDRKKFHIDHKYFLQPREFGDLTLLQIGERFCNAGSGFPEHEQICTEITYVYDGVALNDYDPMDPENRYLVTHINDYYRQMMCRNTDDGCWALGEDRQ